ncbi:hypothetical protein ACHAWU_003235 [Discostella pseudostelligera]|uniref:Vta1/callose synthase N-terminal domain-containing protein n=1 Tax=Discostella pseudostelligera TaxID=259834 RepID=A0ABD3MI03_9STRA
MVPPRSSTSSTSPSTPDSLKRIKVFLNRANELDLDKDNPESRVLAYNCRQYAVHVGIPLAGQDESARQNLSMILYDLEKEKDALSVLSKDEHWQICRKVADKVLTKADAEDRAGMANEVTAKTFYVAATFFEVLQLFYPSEGQEEEVNDETVNRITEEEQRLLYCRWKAREILKAIKEGQTPTPGGYHQQLQQEQQQDVLVDSEQSVMSPQPTTLLDDLPTAPPLFAASDLFHGRVAPVDSPFNNDGCGGGFEMNLNGDATPAENLAARNATKENKEVDITPVSASPLSSPPRRSSTLSSSTSAATTTLSKAKLADAVELTTFALAALRQGEVELGRDRLERALGLLRR